jgi:hypothetical protein
MIKNFPSFFISQTLFWNVMDDVLSKSSGDNFWLNVYAGGEEKTANSLSHATQKDA